MPTPPVLRHASVLTESLRSSSSEALVLSFFPRYSCISRPGMIRREWAGVSGSERGKAEGSERK